MRTGTLLVILALLGANVGRAEEQPEAPQETTTEAKEKQKLRIGVVDVQAVLDEYDRTKLLLKEVKLRLEEPTRNLAKEQKAIQQAVERLKLEPLNPDSPAFQKRRHALEDRHDRWQKERQRFLRERQREKAVAIAKLMDDILEAIAIHGREEGYDLILRYYEPMPLAADASVANNEANTLLYYSGSFDVSEEVAKRLNDAFAKGVNLGEERRRRREEKVRMMRDLLGLDNEAEEAGDTPEAP